jgi:hypothetical protein
LAERFANRSVPEIVVHLRIYDDGEWIVSAPHNRPVGVAGNQNALQRAVLSFVVHHSEMTAFKYAIRSALPKRDK